MPPHHIAKESGDFVVEVVSGSEDIITQFQRHTVHFVAFDQPTERAWTSFTTLAGCQLGDTLAILLREVYHKELCLRELCCALSGKCLGFGLRTRGVGKPAINAQVDVQPISAITQAQQDIPQHQAVFAAGDGNEHPLAGSNHTILFDGAGSVVEDPGGEMFGAQGKLVLPHVDDR
ncbi:MAG: hypothetical protein BWY63_01447 [Chloroflexi bacterium ADurb.Bin360]|nr:MAG: hypothetical protein BWY63_01447 [Chloroflexi bacterium ADurb.Bin360]